MVDKTSILWAEIDSLAAEVFALKSQLADMKTEISAIKSRQKSSENVLNFNAKS